MKTLSLIIPIYNGAPYIADTVLELLDFVQSAPYLKQVILVNDGSTDHTEQVLKAFRDKKYPFELRLVGYARNRGKGYAIKYATAYLQSVDAVAFSDVELPYGLKKLDFALELLHEYDFVAGTRVDNHKPQYTRYRKFATRFFRLLLPREVRGIKDTQCGFKVFKSSIFRKLFATITTFRWVFDIELFVIAKKQGIRVTTVPVQIKEKCLRKNGGVSLIKHGFYIMSDLLRIRKNIVLHKYE